MFEPELVLVVGRLRRIGAMVNHFKVGSGAGAMVVWQIEPERVGQVGALLTGYEQVSHAYEGWTAKSWPYNLYTMVLTNLPDKALKNGYRFLDMGQTGDIAPREVQKILTIGIFFLPSVVSNRIIRSWNL